MLHDEGYIKGAIVKESKTGVYFDKSRGKWSAYITVNRKRIDLGAYSEKENAIHVRKEAENLYWDME